MDATLLAVNNKLQDVFNTVGSDGIQLPQIVVVGSQSAGKSSVLESIVGKSFLPRGTGIVTRCPLYLQLVNRPAMRPKFYSDDGSFDSETSEAEEWGEFLHKPDQIFTNFEKIRKEIEEETERMAGSNKGIINTPINLKIFSRNVVNLTLVDLPGFTKVPVGDQPANIEEEIKKLVLQYIENPNSIIVAVHAANADIADSEALKVAKAMDLDGLRTMLVLTKLDLMDEGSDALDVLEGRIIPVKLGIIGVVNRSQKAINENKDIDDQLHYESTFLAERYPTVASRQGTSFLAQNLSRLLITHISKCLPDLARRIKSKASQIELHLETFGHEVVNKKHALHLIITEFSRAYCETIEGIAGSTGKRGLCGTTKLYSILHETFEGELQKVQPHIEHSRDDVLLALKNAVGPRPTLYNNPWYDPPFEAIVKDQISKLLNPSLECVDLVHKELLRVIQHCGARVSEDLQRFPELQEKIFEVVKRLLRDRLTTTIKRLRELIETETAYVNKKHPDFDPFSLKNSALNLGAKGSKGLKGEKLTTPGETISSTSITPDAGLSSECDIGDVDSKPINEQFTAEDQKNFKILEALINSYFALIRKTVQDSVPKTIMHFLVNYAIKHIESELFTEIYNLEEAEEFLTESKQITSRREAASNMLEALVRANDIIGEIYGGAENLDDD